MRGKSERSESQQCLHLPPLASEDLLKGKQVARMAVGVAAAADFRSKG